jgi:hypothetical protein
LGRLAGGLKRQHRQPKRGEFGMRIVESAIRIWNPKFGKGMIIAREKSKLEWGETPDSEKTFFD